MRLRRTWLAGLATCLAPVALEAQARVGSPASQPAPTISQRLGWPRSVGAFDSLRSNTIGARPRVRIGSGAYPAPELPSGTIYRPPARGVAPFRSECPMPVYPPSPGTLETGAAARAPTPIDSVFVRGPLCENPLGPKVP